jgi:S1-C subfamily serine protease
MALIPPFFLNCVVSIGVRSGDATDSVAWVGTGFIAGHFNEIIDEQKRYNTFLVTNKHVLLGKTEIILRFNTNDGSRVLDYPAVLVENDEKIWTGHPSADIDVAVFMINPLVLEGDSAEFSLFALDDHSMPIDAMKAAGVSEGDGVFILGFPMGIVAPQRKTVISRAGAIARIRDTLDGHQPAFLIDANIFPGNSGGPVVIRPDVNAIEGTSAIGKAALIGIVKSYLPYSDVAISQQTGNPRVIFEENSGLALVETVDSIVITIQEYLRARKSLSI